MKPPELSIVIPVYNEEGNLRELNKQLIKILEEKLNVKYELFFVDDGSNDNSWDKIRSLKKENQNITGIKLSKNYGHEVAIRAGLNNIAGNFIICMDADLQHPPRCIPEIFHALKMNKFDIVFMKRISNLDHNIFRLLSNRIYYRLFKTFTKIEIVDGISDFFAFNNKILSELKKYKENKIFLRGILLTMGYKKKFIDYHSDNRYSGTSSYNSIKLIGMALQSIVNFTILPIRIIEITGFIIASLSFLYGIYSIFKTLLVGSISGWASLVVSVSFLNGFIILLLSFLAEYLIIMFTESKNRPLFHIEEEL